MNQILARLHRNEDSSDRPDMRRYAAFCAVITGECAPRWIPLDRRRFGSADHLDHSVTAGL